MGQYLYDDSVDTSEKSAVVDWYYKRNGLLHYCKFVNDTVLFASENNPLLRESGWYDHASTPLWRTPCSPTKGPLPALAMWMS